MQEVALDLGLGELGQLRRPPAREPGRNELLGLTDSLLHRRIGFAIDLAATAGMAKLHDQRLIPSRRMELAQAVLRSHLARISLSAAASRSMSALLCNSVTQ